MNTYPIEYYGGNQQLAGYNDLQGFSLSNLTSGGILPLLAIGAVAYFLLSGKGEGVGSLIHKKTVEEQLNKVSAEASAKAEEQKALETLLSAERAYKEAQQRLKDIRSGKVSTSGV